MDKNSITCLRIFGKASLMRRVVIIFRPLWLIQSEHIDLGSFGRSFRLLKKLHFRERKYRRVGKRSKDLTFDFDIWHYRFENETNSSWKSFPESGRFKSSKLRRNSSTALYVVPGRVMSSSVLITAEFSSELVTSRYDESSKRMNCRIASYSAEERCSNWSYDLPLCQFGFGGALWTVKSI